MTSNTETGSLPDHKNRARPVLIGISVVAVLALAASVWFGLGWKNAYDEKSIADVRESALAGAQQAAINLSSVDSARMDEAFDTMLTSVTGDEMTAYLEETKASITDEQRNSGRKISAELLGTTLTELSTDDGTATAVAIIANTTTNEPDASVIERTRQVMRMYLQDVDGTWKVTKLLPVGDRVPLNPDNTPNYESSAAVDPNAVDPNSVDPNAVDPNAVDPNVTPPAGEEAPQDPGVTEGP